MIHDLSEASALPLPASAIGGKAASLRTLISWGFPVPPALVITTEAFRRVIGSGPASRALAELERAGEAGAEAFGAAAGAVRAAIEAAELPRELDAPLEGFLARHPGGVAVRSSGVSEDGAETSFAGQYVTLLAVRGAPAVRAAISTCWASAFTPRVLAYARERGVARERLELAVVVQAMVRAEKSGVAFTVNPLTGVDTEVVIEACSGLGEALVSGAVTPDRYRWDWWAEREIERDVAGAGGSSERAAAAVLDAEEVRALAATSVRIQARYGFPVDVEWAKAEGRVHVLQARPITRIRYGGVEGEWTTADFRDGGVSSTVCTPLMWSLYDLVWRSSMPAYVRRVKLLDRDPGIVWGRMFFARPYWNVLEIKRCLERLPGFVERDFDEDLGIAVAYEGEGFTSRTTARSVLRAIRVLFALSRSIREQVRSWPAFRERHLRRLSALAVADPARLSGADLAAYFEELVLRVHFESESSYFTLIFHNSNLQSLFKDSLAAIRGEFEVSALFAGLEGVSHLRPNLRLWAVSREIRADAAARAYWAETDVAGIVARYRAGAAGHGLGALRGWLQEFGYHGTRELDLVAPRFAEDPGFVVESCRKLVALDDEHDPALASARQHALYELHRDRLLRSVRPWRRRALARKLERVRQFLWWREELRDLSTRTYHEVRRATLAAGRELCARRGALEHEGDVFFLRAEEVIDLLHGRLDLAQARATVRRNRLYHDSFAAFENPPDLGLRFRTDSAPPPAGARVLRGIPCSPGAVLGRVKVIRDVSEAALLERGDILVTRFTDPGWTAAFGLLAGVVTETGGLLSHAAVISREVGIPAILAVRGATELLRDGQLVALDGAAGTITLHDDARAASGEMAA